MAQPFRQRSHGDFALLLLNNGADPNVRASLRERMRFVEDETTHEDLDITPLAWGQRLHDQDWAPISYGFIRVSDKPQ